MSICSTCGQEPFDHTPLVYGEPIIRVYKDGRRQQDHVCGWQDIHKTRGGLLAALSFSTVEIIWLRDNPPVRPADKPTIRRSNSSNG